MDVEGLRAGFVGEVSHRTLRGRQRLLHWRAVPALSLVHVLAYPYSVAQWRFCLSWLLLALLCLFGHCPLRHESVFQGRVFGASLPLSLCLQVLI
jgi:hypothetical protein